jgi:class 3 adenylate cyclase
MVGPLCRVGLAVVLTMLLVIDPWLFHSRVWGSDMQHRALVLWHACASIHFLAFSVAAKRSRNHHQRSRLLGAFFVLSAALFCWFGLISWLLSGDLSTYALFLLTMVCVFGYPGRLRVCINIGSALCLVALVYSQDGRNTFHTSGAALNLLALHVVALLIDRFLMRLNLALYLEKRKVEFERARADKVLYNALPVSVANELKNNNVVKAEQYARMAVLFVDIADFTRFSAARSPDRVVQILNDIFTRFDELVDHYDAEKIKTIGDAYMVVGKGNVSDIARLALEMVAAMQAYNRHSGFSLAVRCGIHVGPTVAGVIGLKRFLYDVWGDAVNMASRMESMGEAGRVHVSEDVYQELAGGFDFQCRGEIEVKGKGRVRTYFLLPSAGPNTPPSVTTVSTGTTTRIGATTG